ncbi:MAG TPA: hypothetical protein DCE42_12065 [Myxococcales bacterium]|nr:hypothetical protein [Deltaproteobacteria bacterium]MBU50171.1 hypothetical protein [Deltaproteobacteria bacterium]HAA55486.1 hypothetical protein [Myxococcales bacterium]
MRVRYCLLMLLSVFFLQGAKNPKRKKVITIKPKTFRLTVTMDGKKFVFSGTPNGMTVKDDLPMDFKKGSGNGYYETTWISTLSRQKGPSFYCMFHAPIKTGQKITSTTWGYPPQEGKPFARCAIQLKKPKTDCVLVVEPKTPYQIVDGIDAKKNDKIHFKGMTTKANCYPKKQFFKKVRFDWSLTADTRAVPVHQKLPKKRKK